MEHARLQREQTKRERVIRDSQKARPSITNATGWPPTLNDRHSPTLRLGHAFGSSHTPCPQALQTKLTINEPGDRYEQEADRVAEQVMRMPDPTLRLQRKCDCGGSTASGEHCEECAGKKIELQRRSTEAGNSSAGAAPPIVHDVLRSPGQPLDQSTRAFMEARFGRDFSEVRVHTDARAERSALALNALAYTLGQNIVFGMGRYAPSTSEGRTLLAHELTHVTQQSRLVSRSRQAATTGGSDHEDERREDSADRLIAGLPIATQHRSAIPLPGNMIMRFPYPGCNTSVTGVANPDGVIDRVRADAALKVGIALANLRAPSSQTLRQLDRHFHCPSIADVAQIRTTLQRVQSSLLGLPVACISGPADCPPGKPNDVAQDGTQRLCPLFFQFVADAQAGQLIAGAADAVGRRMKCLLTDPCYQDFTQPASTFLGNCYAYAYFTLQASGYPGLPAPTILPCRPLNTGFNVVVPPDAPTDPGSIRPLTGTDPVPPRSVFRSVYEDRGGGYFIYHEGLPGGRVYMPGETERFYLTAGMFRR